MKQRPVGKDGDAETVTVYHAKDILFARKGNGIIVKSADVTISMDSKSSWVITGKEDAWLLKHEQGHYDISALAARDFYNQVMQLNTATEGDMNDEIAKINEALQQKIDDTNARYDQQTDHSRNKSEQAKWNKAIETEKQKAGGSIDNLP